MPATLSEAGPRLSHQGMEVRADSSGHQEEQDNLQWDGASDRVCGKAGGHERGQPGLTSEAELIVTPQLRGAVVRGAPHQRNVEVTSSTLPGPPSAPHTLPAECPTGPHRGPSLITPVPGHMRDCRLENRIAASGSGSDKPGCAAPLPLPSIESGKPRGSRSGVLSVEGPTDKVGRGDSARHPPLAPGRRPRVVVVSLELLRPVS